MESKKCPVCGSVDIETTPCKLSGEKHYCFICQYEWTEENIDEDEIWNLQKDILALAERVRKVQDANK